MINQYQVSEYTEQLPKYNDIGLQLASTMSIVFIGLARNCATNLEDRLNLLDEIGSKFEKYAWVIYENDSIDNTKQIIQKHCSTNKILISETLNASHPTGPTNKSLDRVKALSTYRNKAKEKAKELFSDYDLVCVIDTDFNGLNQNGIFNSIYWMNANSSIGGMAGFSFLKHKNNKISNYDSWAYRHTWWSDQQWSMVWFFYWLPIIGSHPFKVNSAFGGCCLYKSNFYFGDCEYEGYDCEHVCFHKNLYNKYSDFNLYVNPSQIMFM